MMILKLSKISMSFGDRMLFSGVDLDVKEGRKIILAGPNGSGKTTLLKILTGELEPMEGAVRFGGRDMGFVRQFRIEKDRTLYEEGLSVFAEALEMYEKALESAKRSDMESYDLFMTKAESLGIYWAEKRVREMLKGVGFSNGDFERKISTLSAGEVTRLQLAKILTMDPDLLILDEPSNYLDVYGLVFLRDVLSRLKGAVIIATHDRKMMEELPDEIWDIDFGAVTSYTGRYSDFLSQKGNFMKTIDSREHQLNRQIDHLEKVIARYRKWGRDKAIRQAKSKEKLLEKVVREKDRYGLERVKTFKNLSFNTDGVTEEIVLKVDELEVLAGKKRIGRFSFEIHNAEKIALLGKNGIGKTTLMKAVVSDKNHARFGLNSVFAYVDTVGSERTPDSVLKEVWKLVPEWPDYEVRKYIGRFGFEGDDVFKRLDSLSGGEFVRIEIAKALLKEPNFLLMDEPTNHLDIYMIEALEETLKNYNGAVFFTTHDLEFAEHIADRFFILKEDGLEIFDSFDRAYEFLRSSFNEKRDSVKESENSDFERRKGLKNRLKSIDRQLEEMEGDFESLEKWARELNAKMIVHSTDHAKLSDLVREKEENERKIERIIKKIETLEREKESLEEEI